MANWPALLGGMGINLLSSELYDWRKRKDAQIEQEQIEQELPARLAELATTDAAWRELLDKLLQAAQVEAAVQSQLGAAAAPYLAALQQDAARLGSRLIVANVSGAKYVQIGDGDMTISETTNNYFGPQPPISFADVVRLYLARERRICDEAAAGQTQGRRPPHSAHATRLCRATHHAACRRNDLVRPAGRGAGQTCRTAPPVAAQGRRRNSRDAACGWCRAGA
jgi:hypothetical protein